MTRSSRKALSDRLYGDWSLQIRHTRIARRLSIKENKTK